MIFNPNFNEENLDRRWIWLTCAFLFLATIFLYDQTFQYGFVQYDDYKIIGGHPHLYFHGTIFDRINQILFLDYPREEPLIFRDLSWLLDSVIFGYYRPFGYHFGNVVYHAITVVLAFLLFLRLTNFRTALLSSVMVAVLAVNVEPVAWVMGRKDILSALCGFLSVHLFLNFRNPNAGRKKNWSYFVSLLFASAAYLSKLNAVVLPGLLFLCAMINNREIMRAGLKANGLTTIVGRTLLQLIPFLLISVIVFLWYRSVLQDFGLLGKALEYSSRDYWRLIFILDPLIFLEYLKIIFVPEQLSAYYTSLSLIRDFSVSEISLAFSIIALTGAAVILLWRFSRISCLLFLCFLVLMLPYGNWVHIGFWYANRYVYFSSMFLIAAVANLVISVTASHRAKALRLAASLAIVLFLALNLKYHSEYLPVWENGESLWSYDVTLPDASIHSFNNLTAVLIGMAENAAPENEGLWLEKAQVANDKVFRLELSAGEHRWLAVSHYHKALILRYRDGPIEDQLEQFLLASRLESTYSDALRGAAVSYYQLALREEDPDARFGLADLSLTYFRRHFEFQEKNSNAFRDQRNILSRLKSDFPDLKITKAEVAE